MEGSEILYCLKKGDLEYVLTDIKEYLNVPLTSKDELTKATLKAYSDFAYRFLNVYVCQFNEIPNLEETLPVLRDCYVVARICPSVKSDKEALFVENVFYHLIMKLIKKELLSWAKDFCNCVADELAVLTTAGKNLDLVASMAHVLYAVLWNAVINTDKKKSGMGYEYLCLSLECRATALRLLTLANKEAKLLVDRTCSVVSKTKSMIKSEPSIKAEAFSFVQEITTNGIKALCTKGAKSLDPEDFGKGVSELLISQIQFILHFGAFSEAADMCRGLHSISKYLGSCDSLGQMFSILEKILNIAIHSSKMNASLSQRKKLHSTDDLCKAIAMVQNTNEVWLKLAGDIKHSYPILRSAMFTLDLLHQLAQNMSHMKLEDQHAQTVAKHALQFTLTVIDDCTKMLRSACVKPEMKTSLYCHLVEIHIFHLRTIYYAMTLFAEDADISEHHQSAAQSADAVVSLFVHLDKDDSYYLPFHTSFAETMLKLGRKFYFSRKFADSIPYFLKACDQVADISWHVESLPESIKNGRHHVFLADAYRQSGQNRLSLQTIVHGITCCSHNLSDLLTSWVKVKVNMQDQKTDPELLSRTLYSCYKDDSFITVLSTRTHNGSGNKSEREDKLLSARFLLEAELQALKEHVYPVYPAQLAVINDLIEVAEDPVERLWLEVNSAQVLWLTHSDREKLQQICHEAIDKFEAVLKSSSRRKSYPYIQDQLAITYLWLYILRDVDPVQILNNMKEKNETKDALGDNRTASDSRPSTPTEDLEGFDDYITISLEDNLLQPINQALELWEGLIGSDHMTQRIRNMKETAQMLLLLAAIYRLSKKHTHQWRALVCCLTVADATRCHLLCLQARTQMMALMNELRQPYVSSDIAEETDSWLQEVNMEKLLQNVQFGEYLQVKANTLRLLGKHTESIALLRQAEELKVKYLKPRTKDNIITEATLQALYSRLLGCSSSGDKLETELPSGDTKIELLHNSTRLVSKVVCFVMGGWIINQNAGSTPELEVAPDNTLERWSLLDCLLGVLYEAALCAIDMAEAREALCCLTVGIRLSKVFMLPRRLAEFHLGVALLHTLRGKHSDCKVHLHIVKHILHSGVSTKRQHQMNNTDADDSATDYHLKSCLVTSEDNASQLDSDSDSFDRSGCASPETQKKQHKMPDSWQHQTMCQCSSCSDIASTQISIRMYITEARMNIHELEFAEAQVLLQTLVTSFSQLTAKSFSILQALLQRTARLCKKSKLTILRLTDNQIKQKIRVSALQDQLVDICLQICNIAIERNNDMLFSKWSLKCFEMCDVKKYPWMYDRKLAKTELQYLGAARRLDLSTNTSCHNYDIDQLCLLLAGINIGKGTQCPTPHSQIAISCSPCHDTARKQSSGGNKTSRKEKKESGQIAGSSQNSTKTPEMCPSNESPPTRVTSEVQNLLKAPMKVPRAARSSRTMMTLGQRTRLPKSNSISISSPSILAQTKTLVIKPSGSSIARCQSAMMMKVYEENEGPPVTSRKPNLTRKSGGASTVNMLKTPVSVCNSRRAVLDMLINSDSEDDCSAHDKQINAVVANRSTRDRLSMKKKKSAKSVLNPKSKKGTGTALSPEDEKKCDAGEDCLSGSVYDFQDNSKEEDKSKTKTRVSSNIRKRNVDLKSKTAKDVSKGIGLSQKKTSEKGAESNQAEAEFLADSDFPSVQEVKSKTVAPTRQRKNKSEISMLKTRLTRAKTRLAEISRSNVSTGSSEDLEASIDDIELDTNLCNLDLVSSHKIYQKMESDSLLEYSSSDSSSINRSPENVSLEKESTDSQIGELLNCSIELFRGDVDATDQDLKRKPRQQLTVNEDSEVLRKSRIRLRDTNNEANTKSKVSSTKSEMKKEEKDMIPKKLVDMSETRTNPDEILDMLLKVFNSVRYNPHSLLYRSACHSIALALLHNGASSWDIAFYLTEAQAVTFRHKALLSWGSRLRRLEKENIDEKNLPEQNESIDQKSHLVYMRKQLQFDKTPKDLKTMINKLPDSWTVCQISVISSPGIQKKHLIITRLSSCEEPLVLHLPGFCDTNKVNQLLEEYSAIFRRSNEAIRVTERAQWWKDRYTLDEEIKVILSKFEYQWLGCWKGVLHGKLADSKDKQRLTDGVKKLITEWDHSTLVSDAHHKLELLMLAESHLLEEELFEGIISLCKKADLNAMEICKRVRQFQNVSKSVGCEKCQRSPVILILDKDIQHLPWENFPSLQAQLMTRMPSVYFVSAHYTSLSSNQQSVWRNGVAPNKAFYIVDPDSNLPSTRETFTKWFEQIEGWHGLNQRRPTSKEFRDGLANNDLFVYCGHGSGAKYLSQDSLEMSHCHAATLIMGCSSGKLTAAGRFEAAGTMLHYFIAGGPYIMGCLWDVTDRDIDRYTEKLLMSLLATRGQCMLDTVHPGRSACRMRYLTGAAPVVYGLPVKIALSDPQPCVQ